MSKYIDQARTLVRESEKDLRRILSGAAKGGAYDDVEILSDVARRFAGAIETLNGRLRRTETAMLEHLEQPPRKRLPKQARKTAAPLKGPRFVRDGNDLVKLAWSKAKKSEYEHRAPRRVADQLARKIIEEGGVKKLVPSEKFLPLVDPEDGLEIPSYQTYLCLAWLVQEGLIGKHGRRGYTVFDADRIEKDITNRWRNLPPQ